MSISYLSAQLTRTTRPKPGSQYWLNGHHRVQGDSHHLQERQTFPGGLFCSSHKGQSVSASSSVENLIANECPLWLSWCWMHTSPRKRVEVILLHDLQIKTKKNIIYKEVLSPFLLQVINCIAFWSTLSLLHCENTGKCKHSLASLYLLRQKLAYNTV